MQITLMHMSEVDWYLYINHIMLNKTGRASDIFQDWWARMTNGEKYGGSFSEMMHPII